jgi:hypothetical protein
MVTAERMKKASRRCLEERMKMWLLKDDEFMLLCLRYLYAQQTRIEQECGETYVKNGRGFTAFDAEFLSSIAAQSTLSQKQLHYARLKMVKYAGQLVKLYREGERWEGNDVQEEGLQVM